MIIQCVQCSSKFRLDDSRVTESGVKVRCSKCKHVFVVKKEAPAEEADLDVMLQGLQSPGAAPAGQEPPAEPPPSFEAGETPVEPSPAGGEEAGLSREEAEWALHAPGAGESPQPPSSPVPVEEEGLRQSAQGFGEEPAAPESEHAPEELDFGALSIETATKPEAQDAGEEFSLPVTGFEYEADEKPVGLSAAGEPLEEEEIVFGDVTPESFASLTEPAKGAEGGTAEGEGVDITFEFEEEEKAQAEVAPASTESREEEPFDFGQIDFGIEEAAAPVAGGEVPPPLFAVPEEADRVPPAITATPDAAEPQAEEPVSAVAVPFAENELPPLPISSRRKERSFLPAAFIVVSVLAIVLLAGAGFYFFKEGPEAFKKLGVGFLADWLGMESREEGKISLEKVSGAYLKNVEGGEIFVIRGEAVNNFKKARASIQVKGAVLGTGGQVLSQKMAYCGNPLTEEQLKSMPMAKIEGAMNNQFGDSLSNLGLQPGKRIPFVVVISGVSGEATDYSVDVVGSTVASQ